MGNYLCSGAHLFPGLRRCVVTEMRSYGDRNLRIFEANQLESFALCSWVGSVHMSFNKIACSTTQAFSKHLNFGRTVGPPPPIRMRVQPAHN